MSIVTFINNERVTLASNRVIYPQNEKQEIESLVDKAKHLTELLEGEHGRIKEAETRAYDTGYEKGQEAGYEAALQHIAIKLIALSKDADQTRENLERTAGDLALNIVSRIAEDMGPPATLASLAASAAKQLVPREPVNLRVSVANLEKVQEIIRENPDFEKRISEITGDPALTEDDCILETEFGQIKANLETQLNAFREHFNGA